MHSLSATRSGPCVQGQAGARARGVEAHVTCLALGAWAQRAPIVRQACGCQTGGDCGVVTGASGPAQNIMRSTRAPERHSDSLSTTSQALCGLHRRDLPRSISLLRIVWLRAAGNLSVTHAERSWAKASLSYRQIWADRDLCLPSPVPHPARQRRLCTPQFAPLRTMTLRLCHARRRSWLPHHHPLHPDLRRIARPDVRCELAVWFMTGGRM